MVLNGPRQKWLDRHQLSKSNKDQKSDAEAWLEELVASLDGWRGAP